MTFCVTFRPRKYNRSNRFLWAWASFWTTKRLPKDHESQRRTTDLFERTPKPSSEEQMPLARLTIESILQAAVRFINTFGLHKSFENLLLKSKRLSWILRSGGIRVQQQGSFTKLWHLCCSYGNPMHKSRWYRRLSGLCTCACKAFQSWLWTTRGRLKLLSKVLLTAKGW